MLSGGRHIARDNIFDPAHDAVFAKGERYTNLRLLLNRMVADQPHRIAQMKEVIVELERLEKWEERAVALVLGKTSLAAIDQLKKRTAETLAIRAENAAVRKSEDTIIDAVTATIVSWLEVEIGKLSDHIATEGVINTWVSEETPSAASDFRFKQVRAQVSWRRVVWDSGCCSWMIRFRSSTNSTFLSVTSEP